MFDWNILKQHEMDVPVVVVGNIAAGGTGKTPHVEYIVEALRHSYHIGVVSRGYKRKTKGFVMAGAMSTPRDIGDEPYQIFHHFDGKVAVAVCEDRVQGIEELLRMDPKIDLVVLDDAFQHRYVKPTVSIVVTEFNRPLTADHLLPYGRLREAARGINRAEIVVVSKCPNDMQPIDYTITKKDLSLFPYQSLYFSKFAYKNLMPVFPEVAHTLPYLDWLTENDSLLAVAGIGNPRPFVRHLKSFKANVKVNIFPDHHNFTRKDIELLRARYNSMKGRNRIIITTEKDAVRIACNPYFPHDLKAVIFYLPIEVEFMNYGDLSLENCIRKYIKDKKTTRQGGAS
jgi:tetraacyldisaccharide 4'-kinase